MCSGGDPSQQRFHPRKQLGNTEWFGEVIVGTQIECLNLVALTATTRQHEDCHLRIASHRLEGLQPVRSRHIDVKQQQVESVLRDELQRLCSIRRGPYGE